MREKAAIRITIRRLDVAAGLALQARADNRLAAVAPRADGVANLLLPGAGSEKSETPAQRQASPSGASVWGATATRRCLGEN